MHAPEPYRFGDDQEDRTDFSFALSQTKALPPFIDTDNYTILEQQYFAGVEELRKRAPLSANMIESLWDEHSMTLGVPIRTISAAFEHIQRGLEARQPGRPLLQETIDKVETSVNRTATLEAKRTAKAESKAQYEARLAKYARRRAAINQAKQSVKVVMDQRTAAVEQAKKQLTEFTAQWDNYVATYRNEVKRLETIPADEWQDEE